jgi:hypothetical protein
MLRYCVCHNPGGHKLYMTYERYPSDWHSFILLSQPTIINLQKCCVWCCYNIRSTKQLSIAHRCAPNIADTRSFSHCCLWNDNGRTEIECCDQEWVNERTRGNLSCCYFIAGMGFKLKRSKTIYVGYMFSELLSSGRWCLAVSGTCCIGLQQQVLPNRRYLYTSANGGNIPNTAVFLYE